MDPNNPNAPDEPEMSDQKFLESIAPDVIKCLNRIGFFEKLDDRLCPSTAESTAEKCNGDFRISESILLSNKFPEQDLSDVFGALHSRGACCDCEVLYNVADSNRLKAIYWRARASGATPDISHS